MARGGHLVVAVGANWQGLRDSVLGPILPAVPTGQERLKRRLEALDTFAGAGKPITPRASPPVAGRRSSRKLDKRGGKVLSSCERRAAGGPGRARVRPGDARGARRRPEAVRRLARPRALLGQGAGPAPPGRRPQRRPPRRRSGSAAAEALYQSGVSDLASQLRMALEQFPGVKLIPFGWVAFFIFLYILLIGPGDYFFLKKVLKRMELTWVTFPMIVLAVSLLAYFAAYRSKGTICGSTRWTWSTWTSRGGWRGGRRSSTCSARRTATTTLVVPSR